MGLLIVLFRFFGLHFFYSPFFEKIGKRRQNLTGKKEWYKKQAAGKTMRDGNMIPRKKEKKIMMILDRIALILTVIGALNWGSIGLFQFDVVAWICGGQGALLSRIIYTVVAIAGVWCISLIFRERESFDKIKD